MRVKILWLITFDELWWVRVHLLRKINWDIKVTGLCYLGWVIVGASPNTMANYLEWPWWVQVQILWLITFDELWWVSVHLLRQINWDGPW